MYKSHANAHFMQLMSIQEFIYENWECAHCCTSKAHCRGSSCIERRCKHHMPVRRASCKAKSSHTLIRQSSSGKATCSSTVIYVVLRSELMIPQWKCQFCMVCKGLDAFTSVNLPIQQHTPILHIQPQIRQSLWHTTWQEPYFKLLSASQLTSVKRLTNFCFSVIQTKLWDCSAWRLPSHSVTASDFRVSPESKQKCLSIQIWPRSLQTTMHIRSSMACKAHTWGSEAPKAAPKTPPIAPPRTPEITALIGQLSHTAVAKICSGVGKMT